MVKPISIKSKRTTKPAGASSPMNEVKITIGRGAGPLKFLSRGFIKLNKKIKNFDQIVMRILGRPCTINFSALRSIDEVIENQKNDPQLINADILNIAQPFWLATIRRVVKLLPSRIQSTS